MAKVLIIGKGAREHALAYKLAQSPQVTKLYAIPGSPGIAEYADLIDLAETDSSKIVLFAQRQQIDLVVIGPEQPLVNGLSDVLQQAGIAVFGPNKKCAQLEGSKKFAKQFMARHGIPTAAFNSFDDITQAELYVNQLPEQPLVVKADGLAAGKGVVITENKAATQAVLKDIMLNKAFGEAGRQVVIESYLQGEEVSLLMFTDGKTMKPMLPVQDHKPIGEGDTGLNTGGMGTYAPASIYTAAMEQQVQQQIVTPLLKALQQENLDYRGCLYIGLMLTQQGPYVIEFNARFGDPETEVLMPLLRSDLYEIMQACCNAHLAEQQIEWHSAAAVCVIMAAKGYPQSYESGKRILDRSAKQHTAEKTSWVFHAGTRLNEQGELVTASGRVLAVTAIGQDLVAARKEAYDRIDQLSFDGCYYRRDIGFREFKRQQIEWSTSDKGN